MDSGVANMYKAKRVGQADAYQESSARSLKMLRRPILAKSNIGFADNIHLEEKKRITLLVLFVFMVSFLLCWLLLSQISPFFWAKTSLTASVQPKSAVRGTMMQFSGTLSGEDVVGKNVTLAVTCPDATRIATLYAITDTNGYWHGQWLVPATHDLGKHTVTASFETLEAIDNFMVKFAAPQNNGE